MNTIDYRYQSLLQDILDNGEKKQTRNGEVLSVFGRQIRHKMSDGFPILTTKKMYWKGIVTELLWFLRGDTNIKFLLDNDCHIWDGDAYQNYLNIMNRQIQLPKINPLSKEEFITTIKINDNFAWTWGDLGPIYGKQWRRVMVPYDMMVIDQIANLINDLKTDPDSRRLMVNAWNVAELDLMVLPPCHYGFQVYTRELSTHERMKLYDKSPYTKDIFPTDTNGWNNLFDGYNIPTRAISLMWNQRSVDTPLGLPFNIASYGLLLEIIAEIVNMVPDELIGNLGDCHIYTNQVDGVKEQLTKTPYELPKLNINTEFWPTESGECGVGPIDAMAVVKGFSDDNFCKCLLEDDIQLGNYQSHPKIVMPLSN